MKNEWHKTVLLKYAKDIVGSASTYLILALVFLLWRFAFSIEFHWQQIEPFEQPSIFVRTFYSAFTFATLGLFLYIIQFYRVLHDILVKGMGLWGLYNFIKAIVWACLMYISYQWIVPWLFTILNTSISFLYNIAGLVLYVLPPVGVTLVAAIAFTFWKIKKSSPPPYEAKKETTKS